MKHHRTPSHPSHVRAEAVALAAEIGPAKAAEQLGLNSSTLRNWIARDKAAVTVAVATVSAAGVEVEALEQALGQRGQPWTERAEAFALATADVAVEALAEARKAIAEGRPRDAKALTTAFAILTDKTLLLAGRPTRLTESRNLSLTAEVHRVTVETDDELRRQVDELRAELGLAPPAVIDVEEVDDAGT